MQNSQRVLLAKPRTAAVSHRGQWRGGAMGTSRPTAKPHEECARAGARGVRTAMGHDDGTRAVRTGGGTEGAHSGDGADYPKW